MSSRLRRALGGVVAIGLVTALVPFVAGPAAAAPGAQPDPTLNPDPVATATTPFTLSVSGNASCDGTGAAGWRAHTFIVNDGVDLSTLDFTVSGLPAGYIGADFDSNGGTIAAPLHKGTEPGVNLIPATNPAGLLDPSDLAGFTFDPSFWNLTDGQYQIGFACADGSGNAQQWWALSVTVDADASPNPFMTIASPTSYPKPNISIGDASIVEGNAGKVRHLKFSVTLTGNSPTEVTAEYTVSDGTATGFKRQDPGVDYKNPGVTKIVKFPVRLSTGTTAVRKVISIPVYPDTDVEGDETLTVTLANPTGGVSLGRSVATGTIIDDDPGSGPALAIGDVSIVEGDLDKRVAQLGVTLSQAVTEEVLVDYTVVGGTATCAKPVGGSVPSGTDCNDLAGKVRTMRWRPGLASGETAVYKAIAVQLFADLDVEGDETVTVVLSNLREADGGSNLGLTLSRSVGTITIVDDD